MINFKKIGVLGLSALSAFAFTSVVNAEKSYHFDTYKGNGVKLENKEERACQSYDTPEADGKCYNYLIPNFGIQWNGMNVTKNGELNLQMFYDNEGTGESPFSMKVYGEDLDNTKNYKITYKYEEGNINIEKSVSAANLAAGVTFEINATYGMGKLTVTEEGTNVDVPHSETYNKCWYQNLAGDSCEDEYKHYENVYIKFSSYYKELVDLFNSISKDGVIKLNAIKPSDEDFMWVTSAAVRELLPSEYDVYSDYAYDSSTNGYNKNKIYLNIIKDDGENIINQTFLVKYEFVEPTEEEMAIVNTLANKLTSTWDKLNSGLDNWFVLEDMENINYLYNLSKTKKFIDSKLPNYVSKLDLIAEYDRNIGFDFQAGAGMQLPFYHGTIGGMSISYKGTTYKTAEPVGFLQTNVIYVPNSTDKSSEAFMNAAKDRIQSYLKSAKIEISVGGRISDIQEREEYEVLVYDENTDTHKYIKLFDEDKTLGEWYKVKIDDKEYSFFIVADESKMNTPFMKTVDTNTKVYITTDSYDSPLDAKLTVNKLDKTSELYKKISKKVKILDGMSYDIGLYSDSLKMKIEQLKDGSFKVYIPLDAKYKNKKLTAAYLKDDGNIEYHEIKYENGYGVFTTDHFSVYAITEMNNPSTGDNVLSNLIILGLSAGAIIILNKKFFFSK